MIPRLGPIGDRPTLGHQIVDWIESFLRHGPGDVAGEPIRLDDELVRHICWLYLLGDDGRRAFRRAVLSRPKGRAKSEVAGMIVCVEAIGPSRFSHWAEEGEVSEWGYPYQAGEPVGMPVRSPFIRCLATEESQAGNTYDNVHMMLQGQEVQEAYSGLDVGLTRVFLPGGGEITPSTASSASKDGGKETLGVADETHLYRLGELRGMHQTVSRNLGKRKAAEPWMYETTTAYAPGEQSIAESAREYALQLGSIDKMIEAGFLYDHREADELSAKDWKSDKKLKAALVDVYGPAADWMDLDRIVADIRDPSASEADSRRYWLNQIVAGDGSWMDIGPVKALIVTRDLKRKELVAVGFDGSRFSDSTALMVVTADGYLTPHAVWEKPTGVDDWEVPEEEVNGAVEDLFAQRKPVLMYCDPYMWEETIGGWSSKYGVVKEFRTSVPTRMAHAIAGFETAIRAKSITHSGGVITEHISNAVSMPTNVKLDERGTRGKKITKDHEHSPRKIDVAVASVIAVQAWQDAIANGLFKRRRRGRSWGAR